MYRSAANESFVCSVKYVFKLEATGKLEKKTVLNIVINICELEVLPCVCVFSCVYVHHAHLIDVSKLRAASDTEKRFMISRFFALFSVPFLSFIIEDG